MNKYDIDPATQSFNEWDKVQKYLTSRGQVAIDAGRLAELKQERAQLQSDLATAREETESLRSKLKDIWLTFYGQNLRLENWHRNGDLEPIDSFFEDNDWAYEAQPTTQGERG